MSTNSVRRCSRHMAARALTMRFMLIATNKLRLLPHNNLGSIYAALSSPYVITYYISNYVPDQYRYHALRRLFAIIAAQQRHSITATRQFSGS